MRYFKFLVEGVNSFKDYLEMYDQVVRRFATLRMGWDDRSPDYMGFEVELNNKLSARGYTAKEISLIQMQLRLLLGQTGVNSVTDYLKRLGVSNDDVEKINELTQFYLNEGNSFTKYAEVKSEDDVRDLIDGDEDFENWGVRDALTENGITDNDLRETACSIIKTELMKKKGLFKMGSADLAKSLRKSLIDKGLISMIKDLKVELSGGRITKINYKTPKKEIITEGFDTQFNIGKLVLWDEKAGGDLCLDVITYPWSLRTAITRGYKKKLYKDMDEGARAFRLIKLDQPSARGAVYSARWMKDIVEHDKHLKNKGYDKGAVKSKAGDFNVPAYMAPTICDNCMKENDLLKKNRLFEGVELSKSSIHCFYVSNIDDKNDLKKLVGKIEDKFKDRVHIKGYNHKRGLGSLLMINKRRTSMKLVKDATIIDVLVIRKDIMKLGLREKDVFNDIRKDALLRYRMIPLDNKLQVPPTERKIEIISEGRLGRGNEINDAKLVCSACNKKSDKYSSELPTYDPVWFERAFNKEGKYSVGVLDTWGDKLTDNEYFKEQEKMLESRVGGLRKEESVSGGKAEIPKAPKPPKV